MNKQLESGKNKKKLKKQEKRVKRFSLNSLQLINKQF